MSFGASAIESYLTGQLLIRGGDFGAAFPINSDVPIHGGHLVAPIALPTQQADYPLFADQTRRPHDEETR